jgi:DNA mismatch endonuclease (patch repair protein)
VDRLTPEQRSNLMAKVRQKGTDLELQVSRALRLRGLRFRCNVRTLAGSPDLVFTKSRLVVFIDGDFWHGYRFRRWEHKLAPYWRQKIEANRLRDRSNFGKLRRRGWRVLRVWGHEIKEDLNAVIRKIIGRLLNS